MTRLFRTILVPHDFSPEATRALGVAAELATTHKGRLVVLHALAPSYPAAAITTPAEAVAWLPLLAPSAELVADTRRRLAALVDRAVRRKRGLRVECRVTVGDPFQRIIEAARGATVIVLATLGRTGLAHLLIGSVAEKVVRHSPIPVLTIRPPGARGSAARTRRGRGR
jgi:nucleotide-binding universal stress UspA family protein